MLGCKAIILNTTPNLQSKNINLKIYVCVQRYKTILPKYSNLTLSQETILSKRNNPTLALNTNQSITSISISNLLLEMEDLWR